MIKPIPTSDATRVVKKLHPGSPGTQRHIRQFGDRLLCVRYRDDPKSHRRLTTVELVIEERPIPLPRNGKSFVRIEYPETRLQQTVKQAGGRWNPQKRLWLVPNETIRRLGLTDRVSERAIDAKG